MQQQLNRIEEKLDASIEHQKATHRRLFGDDKLMQEGLVHEVAKNTKVRKRHAWIVGIATGIGASLAWAWHKLIEFFNHI